jgi:hypothetical protein
VSNKKILTKAIEKAIANGWKYPLGANCYEIHKYIAARPEVIAFGFREEWQDADTPGHLEGHWSTPELIFNHDFAKAIAKDDWEKFLCDLVVKEDPIKELAKWL